MATELTGEGMATERLEAEAARGDADAQVVLGKTLAAKGNLAEAASWFAKAARAGDAEGQYYLGICLMEGQGVVANVKAAIAAFESAANQGHEKAPKALSAARFKIAKAEEVFRALKEEVQKGEAQGQYDLGMHYLHNMLSPSDPQMASMYLELAARQNHPGAQFSLSVLYEEGQGIAKNKAQSILWLSKAVAAGHGDAMLAFAKRYGDGRITSADLPSAASLFAKCRTLYPEYRDPAEPAQTFEQLQADAEGGNLLSLFLLAMACFNGEGTARSPDRGVDLLRKAVARNYPPAQYELARRYSLGEDVQADLAAGRALAIKAASHGHAGARALLETMFEEKKEWDEVPSDDGPVSGRGLSLKKESKQSL